MADMAEMKQKVSRLTHAFGKIDNTYFTHDSVKFQLPPGGALPAVTGTCRTRSFRLAHGTSLARILRESPVNLNFYALRDRPATRSSPGTS
jgi:hypothetical protein